MLSMRGLGLKNRSLGQFSPGKGVPGGDANFSDCDARLGSQNGKGAGVTGRQPQPFWVCQNIKICPLFATQKPPSTTAQAPPPPPGPAIPPQLGDFQADSQLWWSEGYFLSMLTMPRSKAIQVVDNENKIFIKDIWYPAMIFFNKHQNLLIAVGLALVVLVFGYYRMVPEVCGNFHDDGIYGTAPMAPPKVRDTALLIFPDHLPKPNTPFSFRDFWRWSGKYGQNFRKMSC